MNSPFIRYPVADDNRHLFLDIDIGQEFIRLDLTVRVPGKPGEVQRPVVCISNGTGKWPTMRRVARLIANPHDNKIVRHLNGNTFDCRAANLECVSRSDSFNR